MEKSIFVGTHKYWIFALFGALCPLMRYFFFERIFLIFCRTSDFTRGRCLNSHDWVRLFHCWQRNSSIQWPPVVLVGLGQWSWKDCASGPPVGLDWTGPVGLQWAASGPGLDWPVGVRWTGEGPQWALTGAALVLCGPEPTWWGFSHTLCTNTRSPQVALIPLLFRYSRLFPIEGEGLDSYLWGSIPSGSHNRLPERGDGFWGVLGGKNRTQTCRTRLASGLNEE